ncbi:hypothetical protein LTS13_008534 [Exophiala xenobiotica]|uniref:Zn(2)-C6 fungal-type domain-containing protein n=1 Tax=Vermiconidia calcicola TaxID=1690605 RepID=A0AAV9Q9B3_9PEZI|nr:hypothetical protein LTR92_005123 [Exophiala xenobiotica]KAK5536864.1 hypothetical protein LTR25_005539 [Vermiconidia calcicola]KAK5543012.1 hypothetical protein LTR23_005053 [Chaetothyriales sp. CCFEE 6169]KAK5278348.1 hypothetical protein LTR40_009257 [Exophiala xenobiotica]KAK5365880.1 hypothetical protein LTS13_008534 [Exophiala xenobiotica]
MSGYRPISSKTPGFPTAPPREPELRARKNVSFACQGCKEARRKCSGKHPCERCKEKGHECVFDQENDGRHKAKLRLKIQEHENDSRLLHALLQTLRASSESLVEEVLCFIRGNPSLDALRQFLQKRNYLDQSEEASTSDNGNTSSQPDTTPPTENEPPISAPSKNNSRRRVLNVADLLEPVAEGVSHQLRKHPP